ncbi:MULTISPECIES: phosphoribosyltransferase [Planktothricoides]|uniref:Phosphoribosyltransferase family protein n=1 Tax=Planktothricoides raciborskii GIHE-MW2 TaxID=2792601 RepID=A0AAU8J814_9CYAN|nr:phosphoribosyltransferase family protein [Planktothricoides sp. SR001]KOR34112.1 phosphoribosyltransferase [Planktothricoides sp. SR001]
MSSIPIFRDSFRDSFASRAEAGKQLAAAIVAELTQLRSECRGDPAIAQAKPIVYALPRGGLPVAVPIAEQLQCPLDIVVAKKITTVFNPELAIGALTPDGEIVWGHQEMGSSIYNGRIREKDVHHAQAKAEAQLAQLSKFRPHVSPEGKIAILVDDGIATGMTMAVAAKAMQAQKPAQVWIAVPVAPLQLMSSLEEWCDRAIVLATPDPFISVSRFYVDFPQVDLSEAQAYLEKYNQRQF